jgi:hypothetical protein
VPSTKPRSASTLFDSVHLAGVTLYKPRFSWLLSSKGRVPISVGELTDMTRSGDAIVLHSARKRWLAHTPRADDHVEWLYAVELMLRLRGSVELYVIGTHGCQYELTHFGEVMICFGTCFPCCSVRVLGHLLLWIVLRACTAVNSLRVTGMCEDLWVRHQQKSFL